jgi:hypothetical protein
LQIIKNNFWKKRVKKRFQKKHFVFLKEAFISLESQRVNFSLEKKGIGKILQIKLRVPKDVFDDQVYGLDAVLF